MKYRRHTHFMSLAPLTVVYDSLKVRLWYRVRTTRTTVVRLSSLVWSFILRTLLAVLVRCLRAPSIEMITWRNELRWLAGECWRRKRARWRNCVTHRRVTGNSNERDDQRIVAAGPEIVGNGEKWRTGAVPSPPTKRESRRCVKCT